MMVTSWISVAAQDTMVPQKDLTDLLFPNKQLNKKKGSDSIIIKKFYPSYLPIPGYNPALGFVLGAGVSAGMLMGNSHTTHLSTLLSNVTVTTKKQLNVNIRTNIYLKNDQFILQGDWRWLLFSQDTYGLGVNFRDVVDGGPIKQPMKFNYIRFNETVYKAIKKPLYAGIGLNIDYHYAIQDQLLVTSGPNRFTTEHYIYSLENHLPIDRYSSVGFSFNLLFDNRNNAANPSRGTYALISVKANNELLGSTKNNTTLYYEYRTYMRLFKYKKQSSILGFWTWSQLLAGGKQPYLQTPAISWDMYNRSGRGYVQGRIRGESFWYGETEYRFPISPNGLLGGVAFFNVATASNAFNNEKLGQFFSPAYGAGIRIKISKITNTNIAIDYGRGIKGSSGIYFNLQETF